MKIEFDVENAAFEDDFSGELKRVLLTAYRKLLAQKSREPGCVCDAPESDDVLLDVNGNRIGAVELALVDRAEAVEVVSAPRQKE